MLRERKFALNRLFDKGNLQPISSAAASRGSKGKGKSSMSKRGILEKYDVDLALKKKKGLEDDEGEEMDENQLSAVCELTFLPALWTRADHSFCRLESDQERRQPAGDGTCRHLRTQPARM